MKAIRIALSSPAIALRCGESYLILHYDWLLFAGNFD